MSLKFLIIFYTVNTFHWIVAYKYKLIPHEKVMEPCRGEEDKYIVGTLFEINITTTRMEDDSLWGNFSSLYIYKKKFDKPISLKVTVFKKTGGIYRETPYVVYRPDLCKSLWDPNEVLWYDYFKQAENKGCPPYYGMKNSCKTQKFEITTDIPTRGQEGEYYTKFDLKTGANQYCFSIYTDVIRM